MQENQAHHGMSLGNLASPDVVRLGGRLLQSLYVKPVHGGWEAIYRAATRAYLEQVIHPAYLPACYSTPILAPYFNAWDSTWHKSRETEGLTAYCVVMGSRVCDPAILHGLAGTRPRIGHMVGPRYMVRVNRRL